MSDITLTIKGLFGHFDYTIPLCGIHELDGIQISDGVTILTGPNGYGKTTILRCLEAIGNGDLGFFFKLNFQELSLHNDEFEQDLTIQKVDGELVINGQELPFGAYELDWQYIKFSTSSSFLTAFANIRSQHKYYPPEVEKNIARFEKFANLLSLIHSYIGNVSLISEQRLLKIDKKTVEKNGIEVKTQNVTEAVASLPGMLKERFSEVSEKYSQVDTQLNSSFPARVLKQVGGNIDEEEFKRRYEKMNEKLRILQENGFSEFGQQEVPEFQADKGGVLRVFFDDFDQKYKEYEPLMKKLTLFRQIIDRRFRRFKRMEISREYGLRVRDIQTAEDGEPVPGHEIPLEQLSSGEKETLVLYYQLLFETKPDTMLLIDEPEISMHIAWQRTFIDELEEIVKLNKLRAVVATHSTSIIGRHRDIQIDLGALYQDGITGNRDGKQPG